MKKLFIFMLTALITFTSVYQLPVFANTNSTDISTKYTYYDDGSYMLEYIIDESNSGITRSSSTTTKSKIASYYSSSNVCCNGLTTFNKSTDYSSLGNYKNFK